MKVKRLLVFLIVILLLSFLAVYYPHFTGKSILDSQNYEKEQAFVTRVVDGDTLVYRIGNISQSCRLLGINTTMLEFIGLVKGLLFKLLQGA